MRWNYPCKAPPYALTGLASKETHLWVPLTSRQDWVNQQNELVERSLVQRCQECAPQTMPGITLSQTSCLLHFLNIEKKKKNDNLPLKPAIGVLLVNPARWLPHFQAPSTFHFICVDLIVICRRSHLCLDIESLEPVRRKFLVYFNSVFLPWKIKCSNWRCEEAKF